VIGGGAQGAEEAGEGVLRKGRDGGSDGGREGKDSGVSMQARACLEVVSRSPSLPPSLPPYLHDHLHELVAPHSSVCQLHGIPADLTNPLVGQVALGMDARVVQEVHLRMVGKREGGREGEERVSATSHGYRGGQ